MTALRVLVAAAGLVLVACSGGGPRPIALGADACGYCRMTITDARFATEARLRHGRLQVFDSIECVAGYAASAPDDVETVWVTDFDHPGTLIPADSATFWLLAGSVSSPMGRGLVATAAARPPQGVTTSGPARRWRDVLVLNSEAHDDHHRAEARNAS